MNANASIQNSINGNSISDFWRATSSNFWRTSSSNFWRATSSDFWRSALGGSGPRSW